MSTASSSCEQGRGGPKGFCADSELGIWLTETGGGFHSGLVFGAGSSQADQTDRTESGARDMGLSVYADRPIHKHDVLARCPLQAVIDRHHSSDRITKFLARLRLLDSHESLADPDSIDDFLLGFLDRTVISLYLILTKVSLGLKSRQRSSEGEDPSPVEKLLIELFSFHAEYVRLLPKQEELMTPLFWNDAELVELRSTSLLQSVNQQRTLWTDEYGCLGEKILSESADLHAFIRQHVSCLDYFWASTIVNSRSFPSSLSIPPTSPPQHPDRAHAHPAPSSAPSDESSVPILLPGVDIFNHKRGSKVEWRPATVDGKSIEIVSLEEQIPRGEQVFNNYGPKSSAELILGYGFVLGDEEWKNSGEKERRNPDDFYPIRLSEPEDEVAYSALVGEIFSRFRPDDLLHHLPRDGQIPSLLMGQLRISMISSDEELLLASHRLREPLLLISSASFLDAFRTAMAHQLSWDNELNCIDCLSSLVKYRLHQFLHSHPSFPHGQWSHQVRTPVKRMIEIYLNGQVDILNEILKVLKDTFLITLQAAKLDGYQFNPDDYDDDDD